MDSSFKYSSFSRGIFFL